MAFTISQIAENPELLTLEIALPTNEPVLLRPLEPHDITLLAQFLEDLSPQTREFYTLNSYDIHTAQEMCDAINRYDKLRFVVTEKPSGNIFALFEYSFDIPEGDMQRFVKYNFTLNPHTDCRFGPCIADRLQNQGIGSAIFPTCIDIARQFEKKRMILWGGVLRDNQRAIRFYEKHGFKRLGNFTNRDNKVAVDMIMSIL